MRQTVAVLTKQPLASFSEEHRVQHDFDLNWQLRCLQLPYHLSSCPALSAVRVLFAAPDIKMTVSVLLHALPFVNIGHKDYISLIHFFQKSCIYEISCLFTFCPYSKNVVESASKCVTTLVEKNICVIIPLHADFFFQKGELPLHSNF